MKTRILIFFSLVIIFVFKGYADSPLTSTAFYEAYLDIPIIKKAASNRGVLSVDAKRFLYNDNNPLDQRMALVNAVGWNFNGLTSYQEYLYFCKDQYRTENNIPAGQPISDIDIMASLSPQQLSIVTYLSAMSNYFEMQVPYLFARLAWFSQEESQAYMLPIALVLAQSFLDSDWGSIYPVMEDLFVNAKIKNMRPAAVKLIMNYIDIYKEYSNDNK